MTFALDGKELALDRIVGRGAIWATIMAVFNLVFMPGSASVRPRGQPSVSANVRAERA